MFRFRSIFCFLNVISFLLIFSSPKASGAEIDRGLIREQLGVEYKAFYKTMTEQILVWLPPASYDLGKSTKLQQFSHMDLIEKAAELSQKIEDETMILDQFKAQKTIIQTHLAQIRGNNSERIHAKIKRTILNPWKVKSIYEFDQSIVCREKDIERYQLVLKNVEEIKLKVEGRTMDRVTLFAFRKYIETNSPDLMSEESRSITLEEMKAFFE
jgi:hypothetical protein